MEAKPALIASFYNHQAFEELILFSLALNLVGIFYSQMVTRAVSGIVLF